MGNTKSYRHFNIRAYFDNENCVRQFIEKFGKDIRNYCFILHDKDVYNDDTENHIKGDIKKAHYHIIVNTKDKITENTFIKICNSFSPENKFNHYSVSHTKDIISSYDYLTHNTTEAQKQGKYKYNSTDIKTNNIEYFTSQEAEKAVKEENKDWTVELYRHIIENSYIKREYFDELVNEYGRDFLFNFDKVAKAICARCGKSDVNKLFKPISSTYERKLSFEEMKIIYGNNPEKYKGSYIEELIEYERGKKNE